VVRQSDQRAVAEGIPARSCGAPGDVAGPTLLLASDTADFVHGQILYGEDGLTVVL